MDATMTNYLSVLASGGTLKDFRYILVHRYKKFKRLFKILKKYSSVIVGLSYDDDESEDILTVNVDLAGIDPSKLLKTLNAENWNNENIHFSQIDTRTIQIIINESEDAHAC